MKRTSWRGGPYLVWLAAFIPAPLAIVIYFAFTDKQGRFTLANLTSLGAYTTVFSRSIVLAAVATVICLAAAFPVSYLLSRMPPARQRMMQMLIMLPMWMNFLLRTYAWMTLLELNGLLNRFFSLFGLGPFQMINTSGAVVLGMVYNYLPYMVLPLYTIMVKIDQSVIEGARTGAALHAGHHHGYHDGICAQYFHLYHQPHAGRRLQPADWRLNRAAVPRQQL